jgi:putative DNA methylase
MTDHPIQRRKKMIEVAIPLEAINAASAREKSIRHGHPSTLHLWWARRPLAAARAVIFCQMVDDPSAVPEEFPTEEDQENERLRLFALVSELVTWENTTNEQVLNRAREEIKRSWRRACADNADHPEAAELFNPDKLPGFHDPFAGGGALPLEAQRLGLEAYASDLNPVAVLINKAMIEIPPKFAGMPPVNPESRKTASLNSWKGAQGLAEDVRHYGKWMRDEAYKELGSMYPDVEVPAESIGRLARYAGKKLKVVAWIWTRTIPSPSPAFSDIAVPICSSFMLSPMRGKEAYIEPAVTNNSYSFRVRYELPDEIDSIARGTKLSRGGNFRCLLSGDLIDQKYVYEQARNGRLGTRLMAIVAEGDREKVFLSPCSEHEKIVASLDIHNSDILDAELPNNPRSFSPPLYGLTHFSDLFTLRQLHSLRVLSELAVAAAGKIREDCKALATSSKVSHISLDEYPNSVATYLGFLVGKLADKGSTICTWDPGPASNKTQSGRSARVATVRVTFGRQAIPMTWDFAEVNFFSESVGSIDTVLKTLTAPLDFFSSVNGTGSSIQADAQSQSVSLGKVVSTDPPYYDNIPYADLSDFFFVWLRLSLRAVFPKLLSTISTPKLEELVAIPYRHGGKDKAEAHFLNGMTLAMAQLSSQTHAAFPVTIYYAFKQSETKSSAGTASTGWETFLAAVIKAGFALHGTWPMRTELANRMIGSGTNALASSVVLVCHRRLESAANLSRHEFRRLLRQELPKALKELEHANIAPVDVAQAAIGPGMAIYSSAKAVLNPDDSPMSVREALVEINTALDEYLSQDEGDLDADSRFALTFFESYGYEERSYGDAEGLAIARNLSVEGVAEAGILYSVAGKVRLYQRTQLPDDWDPSSDKRLCVWEATQHLIKRLEASGEGSAAELLLQLKNVSGHGDLAANCRALAYRLYNHCEKKKQAEEARAYNGLVIAWPELERLASASSTKSSAPRQTTLI